MGCLSIPCRASPGLSPRSILSRARGAGQTGSSDSAESLSGSIHGERGHHLLHVRQRGFNCKLVNSGLEKAGWANREISYLWNSVGFIKCFFSFFVEVNTVADGGVGSAEPLPSMGGACSLPGGFGKAGFGLEGG